MSYRVVWDPALNNDLQRIYDAAADQEAVANAVTRVGLELSAVPSEAGESREPGVRILCKYPLVVWYRIVERFREVQIFRVRPYRGSSQ